MTIKKSYSEKIFEILEKTNNGYDLQPYHLDNFKKIIPYEDGVSKKGKLFISMLYKHIIIKGDYDSKFEWYHNIPGIKKDNDGDYYYYKENIGHIYFDNEEEEIKYLSGVDEYGKHLISLGMRLNTETIKRRKWYEEITGLMDSRIYNMTHICEFLVKDNRFIFFYDCQFPFIWDSINMEKIYINSMDRIKNKRLHLSRTGWRSIIKMYTRKKVDSITDLSWDKIEMFLNATNINNLQIFNNNEESFKSRKPLFDDIFMYERKDINGNRISVDEIEILSMRPNSTEHDYAPVCSITYQIIENNIIIHEVCCLLSDSDIITKYTIPGAVVRVNNNMIQKLKTIIGKDNLYGEICSTEFYNHSEMNDGKHIFVKSKFF